MTAIGDKLYIYVELVHDVVEYEAIAERDSGWLFSAITSTMHGLSPKVIRTTVMNEYSSTKEEAQAKWFLGIFGVKTNEIQKLNLEIKKKEAIINKSKERIGYNELYNNHPELFV